MRADVAILGSGFGGSLLALVARRLGLSVALVERSRHPRFAIGESSSPLANLLLEEIARRYDLPRLLPLTAFGPWRRTYPDVACGLKRGFSFFAHEEGEPFCDDLARSRQLLVAASPDDEVADTHWYRADFDAFLAKEAEEAGARHLDGARIRAISRAGRETRLEIERGGKGETISTRFVVDATGGGGALSPWLGLARGVPPFMPPTQALFTHFRGVERLDSRPPFESLAGLPYPIDDAAVHHVFPGGWLWVLRFSNGLTSAGLAATDSLAKPLDLAEGEPAWRRLLSRFPTIARLFEGAEAVRPFVYAPRPAFRMPRAAGEGWALLPSAAAFVDPLLSTGFPLTLLGIQRLARALEEDWDTKRLDASLDAQGARTLQEADAAALLVAALYASFDDFRLFADLARLYFAAAVWSETWRRLDRGSAGAFLLADQPAFGLALRKICLAALSPARDREALRATIGRTIEPIDVAGLLDSSRRNWHPVLAEDLLANRHKLGASADEISRLLQRSGFDPFSVSARSLAPVERTVRTTRCTS